MGHGGSQGREGEFFGVPVTRLPLRDAVARIAGRARADETFAYVAFVDLRTFACSKRAAAERRRFASQSWLMLNGSRTVSLLALFAGVTAPALTAAALTKAL